jgi:hypothetical protein
VTVVLLILVVGVPLVLAWLYRLGGPLNGPNSYGRPFATNWHSSPPDTSLDEQGRPRDASNRSS